MHPEVKKFLEGWRAASYKTDSYTQPVTFTYVPRGEVGNEEIFGFYFDDPNNPNGQEVGRIFIK